MRLSAPNLELLRTRPQTTRLSLSIFQPRTVMKCRLNNPSASRGDRTIPYDGVSLGGFSSVEANFTMLVGTTDGAQDIGKIRIRSATSGQFIVGENSNIKWQDDAFLTIQRYVELNPIYPRIVFNPTNEADSTFYKDYDLIYTNQNSILGTFANAGPHRADYITTGSVSFYYSSTGSHNLLGDTLSFNWAFEGGTPTGSTLRDPGYVSYATAGHYVTRLTISGSSGGVDTTYRYVSVYDPNNPPIRKWEVGSINGSRDQAGYKASFKVYENINVQENAVVVLYADDWYGNTNQSLGGNYPNAEKIFFVGYILAGSVHYDYQHSFVEFSVGSITELMKQSLGFSVSVESVASPNRWYELLDLDCRRAIYHYLRWHTTALNIADFQFIGDDRKIQYFDADRASMFDAIDNLMRNTLIGSSVSDRQGKVWTEIEAKAYDNPTGTFTSVMEITKRDWMGEPSIEERLSDDLSYLEFGGIAYSGVVTGTFSALLGSAPGNAPSFRGSIETREGLALLGQAQLNQLVANVWANENSDFPRISLDMGIDARNLDIAPQDVTDVHILASDTVRNLAINGLYIPDSFDWKYDARNGILLPSVDFTNLVNGNTGESINIPISVPDAGFETGWSVPGFQIPPLPILTWPPSLATVVTNIIGSLGVGNMDYAITVYNGGSAFDSSRGISIVSSAPTSSTSPGTSQFQVARSGLYLAIAHASYFIGAGTVYTMQIALITPNSVNGLKDIRFHNSTGNITELDPFAITLVPLIAAQIVNATWTSTSSAGTLQRFLFAMVRLSE